MATTAPADVLALLRDDPFAQRLLSLPIPARLAYLAVDGTPRAIPIAYHFDGTEFVMATPEGAPKIAALQANPQVALTIDTEDQPPLVLMVRGEATVQMVDGVPEEYLAANRRMMSQEVYASFQDMVTGLYDRMARIAITPTWAKVLDFETRIPDTVRRIAEAKGFAPDA